MSITLTTPYTVSVNGAAIENDTVGACTSFSVDFQTHIMTYTFRVGTLFGNPPSLVPGMYAGLQGQDVVITVNLKTAAWSDNHGHGGIIPAGTINPIITQLLNDRNSSESFLAVPQGLMPGTQVPWTQI